MENVQEANNGEPSYTMVTINKAVLFYDIPQSICLALTKKQESTRKNKIKNPPYPPPLPKSPLAYMH